MGAGDEILHLLWQSVVKGLVASCWIRRCSQDNGGAAGRCDRMALSYRAGEASPRRDLEEGSGVGLRNSRRAYGTSSRLVSRLPKIPNAQSSSTPSWFFAPSSLVT